MRFIQINHIIILYIGSAQGAALLTSEENKKIKKGIDVAISFHYVAFK